MLRTPGASPLLSRGWPSAALCSLGSLPQRLLWPGPGGGGAWRPLGQSRFPAASVIWVQAWEAVRR